MNWKFRQRKPEHVIPNPRDKRKKADNIDAVQRGILLTLQFLVFGMALLLLALVS